MTMHLNPYLSFNNNAREAAQFYHSVFGGTLNISTFADLRASQDPSEDDLVMHSVLDIDGGLKLMMSDTTARMEYSPGNNISVSLSGDRADEAVLTGYWNKLVEGANVTMPLSTAVWGDSFGMAVDKFGITWLINIAAAAS
ncbi:MAG TPA: VOC family protein [Galbitalea sp.]|jgi:PhnB protein|nr:VOC family protein [Galbitalea sp.]